MSKPILIELGVVLVAAVGYLAKHDTGAIADRAQTAAAVSALTAAQTPALAVTSAANGADGGFNPDFIKLSQPEQQTVADEIPITGKLSLDKQQVRIASARVAGRLGRIFVFEGQSVQQGEALAEIYSPDYISAEHEFLLARGFRNTLSRDSSDAELRGDAEATVQSAANKLKVLGATPEDIAQLAKTGQADEYLKVRAPISGVVTQRNVDPGGYLNVGDPLMTLANLDTLWLFANTYDSDYPALKLGQQLSFQSSSLPGQTFSGQIAFIAPSIDPATHTLPIRCNVPNPQFLLRPEMFVRGTLQVGQRSAWVVPKSAVIHIRDTDYVIVKGSDGKFKRLAVQGHPLGADQYAITAGLDQATPVISDGGLLINELVNES
jgi:Cu(I)/Ag(I) efflux system membrane fusion protein